MAVYNFLLKWQYVSMGGENMSTQKIKGRYSYFEDNIDPRVPCAVLNCLVLLC